MTAIHAIVDVGLGNSSYLVDLGDGRALVIDPHRDPRPYLALATDHRLRVAFTAETHLHADFVSGSRELAAQGATVLASAAGNREFPHTGLRDGDEVNLGGLMLRAIATPGHTPEHLAYLLLDGTREVALFTGGSLLVDAVARTDLTDATRTEELARLAFRSIWDRLLTLPDALPVYPTHGAGSFCSTPASSERTTTIGRERSHNQLLGTRNEDAFVASLLGSLGTYPTYFHRLPEVNRRGPRVLQSMLTLAQLTPPEVQRLLSEGAVAIDVRPVVEFAQAHVPGALSIALRPAFASWFGWLVPPTQAVVFIVGDDQDHDDLVRQALNIGHENLAGELAGGMPAWLAAGYPTQSVAVVAAERAGATPIIDVRQAAEYDAGHVPGAQHHELGSLAEDVPNLPAGPLAVMCGHGERAMSGVSLLERAGRGDLTAVVGGPDEWAALPGRQLARSE